MQTRINPKDKHVDIYISDITITELKNILKDLSNKGYDNISVHNRDQTTNLIDVYEGNIEIDNLYKIK